MSLAAADFTATSAFRTEPVCLRKKNPLCSFCARTSCPVLSGIHICISKRNTSWNEFYHPLSQAFPPWCRPILQKSRRHTFSLVSSLVKQWSFRGDWPGPGPERDSTSITRKRLCQCRFRARKLIPSEVCGLGKEPPFFRLAVPWLLTWLKGAWGAGWSQRLGSQSFPWQQLRVAWHRHCMWCFSAGVRRGGSHGERAWGQSDSWARRRGPGRAGGGHCRGSRAVLLWSGVGHRGNTSLSYPVYQGPGAGKGEDMGLRHSELPFGNR